MNQCIHLTTNDQAVDVLVRIDKSSTDLAREGTQFWIVKADVSAGQISGLRTIVSGSYIGVQPGHGKKIDHFVAGPEPSLIDRQRPGVRFILLTTDVGSVQQGTPILYRGIKIGEVTDFALGPHSQTVNITIDIAKPYAGLVRIDSKFWNAGGLNVNLGTARPGLER